MKHYKLMKSVISESNELLDSMLKHNMSCAVTESAAEYNNDYFQSKIQQIFGMVEKQEILNKKFITDLGFELDQETLDFESPLFLKAFAFDNELPTVNEYVDLCISAIKNAVDNSEEITRESVLNMLQGTYNPLLESNFDLITKTKGTLLENGGDNVRLGDRVERLNGLLSCVELEESYNELDRLLSFVKEDIIQNESLSIAAKADCVLAVIENATEFYTAHQEAFRFAVMQEKSIILDLLEKKETQMITEEISNNLDIDIF